VTDELTSKILEIRSEVDSINSKVIHISNYVEILLVKGDLVKCTEDIQKWQGESITQLNKEAEAEKLWNEC
jgi:hypothetical protein